MKSKSTDATLKTVNIRLTFTPLEFADLELCRRFLVLPSLSATVARLVCWNSSEIARALRVWAEAPGNSR